MKNIPLCSTAFEVVKLCCPEFADIWFINFNMQQVVCDVNDNSIFENRKKRKK